MTKILVPFKFDADFKLKLDMIAYDNKITKEGPGSAVGLVREALIKTYPALSESIVTVNNRVCEETKKRFEAKIAAF